MAAGNTDSSRVILCLQNTAGTQDEWHFLLHSISNNKIRFIKNGGRGVNSVQFLRNAVPLEFFDVELLMALQ